MEDFEQAIQQVLGDPGLMEQIMNLSKALGMGPGPQGETAESTPSGEESPDPAPQPDLSQLGKLTGLLGQANIDRDQKNLLNALTPYMSSPRISKLRRAMQAARLAELASSMLGNGLGGGQNV